MYHFEYVSRETATPYRERVEALIRDVQDTVRDDFTFQYHFIGSSSRNMITRDPTTNAGFDFDVNLYVNDDEENYSAAEIRSILFDAFRSRMNGHGFNSIEDSTSVITVKHIDPSSRRAAFSCDIAVVYDCKDGRQQYIRFNKESGSYTWNYRRQASHVLEDRADALKKSGYWNDVRDVYLEKKNCNDDPNKHSRSLYAEAVNECYMRFIGK